MPTKPLPEKPCEVCGRRIVWRKKWERDWDNIKVCSEACRKGRLDATDVALERAIMELLGARRGGGTICPSEAARRITGDEGPWEALMERARMAARQSEGPTVGDRRYRRWNASPSRTTSVTQPLVTRSRTPA